RKARMRVLRTDSPSARPKCPSLQHAAKRGDADTVIERCGQPTAPVNPREDHAEIAHMLEEGRAWRRAEKAVAAYGAEPYTARAWDEIKAEWQAEGLMD